MTSGKRLAIFDMDGTLYRSHESVVRSTNLALRDFGLPEKPGEFLTSLIGEKMPEYCRLVAPQLNGGKLGELANLINKYDTAKLHEEGSLYPGARETLDALKTAGFALAICTHAGMHYAEIVLKTFGIFEKFDFIKTRDKELSKAAQIASLIKETGADFAVMAGDREYDREAAFETGIPFVWAKYGYGGWEVKDAHFVAETAADIAPIIFDPAFQAACGLYSKIAETRAAAGKKLKRLGKNALPALKAIHAALWDDSPEVLLESADALGCIGPPAIESVPRLIELVNGAHLLVRGSSAEALGKITSHPELTVPAFIECLSSGERMLRVAALWGLKQFGEQSAPALPSLIECLQDTDKMIVRRALKAISAIGKVSEEAERAILALDVSQHINGTRETASDRQMRDALGEALGVVSAKMKAAHYPISK